MAISSRLLLFNLLLLLQLFWIVRRAKADRFMVPSDAVNDLTVQYNLGQTIQIIWQTDLQALTLLVSHWGGNTVGTLLSAKENPDFFDWTIGDHDNIDKAAIENDSNFVLLIRDPSGQVKNGNGFVDGQLSSRAFVIKLNETSSSNSSTSTTSLIPSTSTISSAPTVVSTTSAPASSAPTPSETASTGLSTAAKGGIGAGASVAGLALLAAGIWLGVQWSRRSNKGSGPQSSSRYEIDGSARPISEADRYNKRHQQQDQSPSVELPANATSTVDGAHEMGAGREE